MLKITAFYIILLGFVLAAVELLAFVAVQFVDRDDFFDSRDIVFARLNEADLADFRLKGADPLTGWNWRGPLVREEANCLGENIEYRYDAAGARLHDKFDVALTEVIMVGDSYANGDEVAENDSISAKLSGLLGVSVANHGVGGYDPTQSVLNLQKNIARYPRVRVVVLLIMYENLYRMMNSYRPVLYTQSSDYSLKPYMADGRIVPHPGDQVFDSLRQFEQVAGKAFDDDFWAKPVAEFPYSLALGRSLASNYFYYRKMQRLTRKLGKPEYLLIFNAREIQRNLIALLNQYAGMAQDWGVQPVAIFVPRNRFDTTSATEFIARHRKDIDARLLLGDVGEFAGVDWIKFNYAQASGDNTCHPSPYGYDAVARYIAGFLQASQVWPAP